MLNLHASSQVEVFDKWSRCYNDFGKRFSRDVLVEFRRIETCPELPIKTRFMEALADD